jgi:hypothetical protein
MTALDICGNLYNMSLEYSLAIKCIPLNLAPEEKELLRLYHTPLYKYRVILY